MVKKIKNEDGFSLLEVILSIAVLAFISVFILQMFVVSSKANLRAKSMDIGSAVAVDIIEQFKACRTTNDFMYNDFIVDSQIAVGLSDFFVVKEKLTSNTFDFSKEVEVYKYYDKNWNTVVLDTVEEEPMIPTNPKVSFIMEFIITSVTEEAEGSTLDSGVLYNISVTIFSADTQSKNKEVVKYETKEYFAG